MISKKIRIFFCKVFPCCISFGILLGFCVRNNNFLNLINIFPRIHIVYFFLSILSIFIYWLTDSLVLREFLPGLSNSVWSYLKITMYGQFYGSITPFFSGHQTSQLLLLKNKGINTGKSISVLSQKFCISQWWTVIISSLSLIFKSKKFRDQIPGFVFFTLIGLAIQCSGILLVIVCYLNKKKVMNLANWFLKLGEKVKIVKDYNKISKSLEDQLEFLMKNNLSINCGISVYIYCLAQNISYCMVAFFISKAFGCPGFPIFDFIAAQSFVNLISIANPLPGSAGTVEASFLFLYKDFFDKSNISFAMILFRLINYYFGVIVGFFVVLFSKKNRAN